jgi:Ca-activated chloride channel family protein
MQSSLSFEYPLAFLVPLIIMALAWFKRKKHDSLAFPATSIAAGCSPSWRQVSRTPVLTSLSIATTIALGLAAARPVEVLSLTEEQQRRNIMLCLDVSKSMELADFQIEGSRASRLTAIKTVIAQFVKRRTIDRLGMVVFGSSAYLQVPLTLDHQLLLNFLRSLRPGLAGGGTAIGDGLGLSVKRIKDIQGFSKAVILVTDGVNNSGNVNPIQAAKLAKSLNIKVHTVGVGNVLNREFDEATLKKISSMTGGVYFNAENTEGLNKIYEEIDELERSKQEERQNAIRIEHFWKFALAGLLLYGLYLTLARTYYLVIP